MPWIEIMPRYQTLFGRLGWDSAAPFLEWAGILVNQHRHRQVEQVESPGVGNTDPRGSDYLTPGLQSAARFFIKKESAVTWRERFRNAWHGFGWCSNSVREAAILQAARAAGVGCPAVAAFGEDESHAFVLLRDESDMVELRALLPTLTSDCERHRLADALGRELAHLHDAGFDHPDLFAKHILAAPADSSYRFCILDWARARRRPTVSWRLRCRDLAVLDATLHEALASDRLRARFLCAYLHALTDAPPLARISRQIRRQAQRLRAQRNLREIGQRATPEADHQFVPLCEGQLLVVRSYYERCRGGLPDWLTMLPNAETQAEDFCLTVACASSAEKLCLQTWPLVTPSWEIPPLAHTLFRLQRFGVRAPRLRAVGASPARVFLLSEAMATIPFDQAFAKASVTQRRQLLEQAGQLIRQVHEAGYVFPVADTWARRLGVTTHDGIVVLAQVEPLARGNAAWQELAPTEFNRQNFLLSRAEQLRFLRGYLGRRRARNEFTSKDRQDSPLRERQIAA